MNLTTTSIRKFAISVDPEEAVDFVEPLGYFDEIFGGLGFEKIGTYKFRYIDEECTLTGNLEASPDGHEVWIAVQAPNEHVYRIEEVAKALGGHIIAGNATGTHSRHRTTQTW